MKKNNDFDPQGDPEASFKFILKCILLEKRMQEMEAILTDGHEIGAVEGDPGWIIERRDRGKAGEMPGYENWPSGADFRAYVDPDIFSLRYPQRFLDREQLFAHARCTIKSYLNEGGSKSEIPLSLMTKLDYKVE